MMKQMRFCVNLSLFLINGNFDNCKDNKYDHRVYRYLWKFYQSKTAITTAVDL